jgi:hypothetical protein
MVIFKIREIFCIYLQALCITDDFYISITQQYQISNSLITEKKNDKLFYIQLDRKTHAHSNIYLP